MKVYYRFTPDICVLLETRHKRYADYFNSEYYFARVTGQHKPDVCIKIVDSLKHTAQSKNAVLRSIHFKNLFWFEYMIDFTLNPITIYMKRHWIEYLYFKAFGPFIQTNVLEPVLYYLALRKNYYLLHAASVAKDGQAYCIAGHGGAGKTMTSLNRCIKEDYCFMGDDLAFIDIEEKKVYAFPRPLHLFGYNLFKIPYPSDLQSRLIFWRIFVVIKLKDIIRFVLQIFTKQKVLISTRIDVRLLYRNQIRLCQEAKLNDIELIGLSKKNIIDDIQKASDLRADLIKILQNAPHLETNFANKEESVLSKLFT